VVGILIKVIIAIMGQDFIIGISVFFIYKTTLRAPVIGSQGNLKIEIPGGFAVWTIFHIKKHTVSISKSKKPSRYLLF
ncbi:MAG: hypothetical protein QME06_09435, partial [Desulfobacterales bacterium]|nr:hypothetical protein [Desulfobacterales bacterium]